MSNRGFYDDGGPVPTVDFDFDSIDGEPILAEGRRARAFVAVAMRELVEHLAQARTARSHHIRSICMRHVLSNGASESVSDIARRLRVSESLIRREIRGARKFLSLL